MLSEPMLSEPLLSEPLRPEPTSREPTWPEPMSRVLKPRHLGYALPLLVWMLLAGALIAAAGWHVYRVRSAERVDSASVLLQSEARHAAERVQVWLDNRIDDGVSLARSPAVRAVLQPAGPRADQADYSALNHELEANADGGLERVAVWAVVQSPQGSVVAASQPKLIGREIAEAKGSAQQPTIQPAQISEVFQGPAFSIVTPIPAKAGSASRSGAVIGWVGLPALSRLWAAQAAGDGDGDGAASSYISDAGGRYLTRPAGVASIVLLQDRASGAAVAQCLSGSSGVIEEADERGAASLVAYRWLEQPSWCVLTRVDQSALTAASAALSRSLLQAGAATWLLVSLVAWLLLRWSQPRKAAKTARGSAEDSSPKPAPPRAPASSRATKPSAAADAQANQSRNDFLTSVSHEIRTPMNGVLGPLALLLRSPLNEQQQELAELAHVSADALLRSIRDVIDGAKLDAGELQLAEEPFNPRQLIEQAAEALVAQAALRQTEVELAHSSELPPRVTGDPLRFRQLLDHLFDNALRCCASGRLKIDLRAFPGWPGYEVIYLRISDGDMQQARMQALAEQLIETDLSKSLRSGGSGLALAICQALTKKMGGRIGGDNKPDGESALWVEIPLRVKDIADSDGEHPAGGAGLRVLPAGPGVFALLVEDNSTNQHVGALMLRSLGCVVEVCGNGQQAIERIESGEFDIVFMDCDMPVMDGLTATRAIRQRQDGKRELPIVAVTAQAMPGDRERCLAAGMNDYLSKPVLDTDFAAALRRWLPTRIAEVHKAALAIKPAEADALADGAGSPALDPVTVNRLRALATVTDPGLLEQIFDAFRHDSRELIETMGLAIEEQDCDALRAAAHMLKGASGTIGARGMVGLCEQLHQQGEEDTWETSGILIARLRAEFMLVLEALNRAQEAPLTLCN